MSGAARDRAWVEREYGKEKWPAIEELLHGLDGPLSAVRAQAIRREHGLDSASRTSVEAVVGGRRVTVPGAVAVPAYLEWVAHTVAVEAQEADAVIELGAGWARQLTGVWVAGGPREAVYVAAEVTASGRRAATALASRDPSLRFSAVHFDYRQLEWPLSSCRRAVVFSAHSVEQVPALPEGFVEFVAGLAEEVKVLHFEPVGWQVAGGDDGYARDHDYNRNLYSLLTAAVAAGRIRITDVLVDAVGVNPDNPTSLITWESA